MYIYQQQKSLQHITVTGFKFFSLINPNTYLKTASQFLGVWV